LACWGGWASFAVKGSWFASLWVLLHFQPSLSSRISFGESIANKFIVLLSSSRRNPAAHNPPELLFFSPQMPIVRLANFRLQGTGTVTRKIKAPNWSISGREH
jgi:hypothetical protein